MRECRISVLPPGMTGIFWGKIKDEVRCVEKEAFFTHGVQRFIMFYSLELRDYSAGQYGSVNLSVWGR
jgi:hypothetical protein